MTDASVAGPPPERQHHSGWLVAFAVVALLALGLLVAAVISRGDEGQATNTVAVPTIQQSTTINAQPATTVEKTVTAPPATVTVQPQVTVEGQTSTTP